MKILHALVLSAILAGCLGSGPASCDRAATPVTATLDLGDDAVDKGVDGMSESGLWQIAWDVDVEGLCRGDVFAADFTLTGNPGRVAECDQRAPSVVGQLESGTAKSEAFLRASQTEEGSKQWTGRAVLRLESGSTSSGTARLLFLLPASGLAGEDDACARGAIESVSIRAEAGPDVAA